MSNQHVQAILNYALYRYSPVDQIPVSILTGLREYCTPPPPRKPPGPTPTSSSKAVRTNDAKANSSSSLASHQRLINVSSHLDGSALSHLTFFCSIASIFSIVLRTPVGTRTAWTAHNKPRRPISWVRCHPRSLVLLASLSAAHGTHDTPKAESTCSKDANSLCLDTHNRLVADVLTRYRTLMMLATIQAEGERNNANPEAIAVTGISMKMEFDGLVSPSLLPSRIALRKTDSNFNAFLVHLHQGTPRPLAQDQGALGLRPPGPRRPQRPRKGGADRPRRRRRRLAARRPRRPRHAGARPALRRFLGGPWLRRRRGFRLGDGDGHGAGRWDHCGLGYDGAVSDGVVQVGERVGGYVGVWFGRWGLLGTRTDLDTQSLGISKSTIQSALHARFDMISCLVKTSYTIQ